MTCYHPILAIQSDVPTSNGTYDVRIGNEFSSNVPFGYHTIKLPCGKCIGCLLERSRQWAVRCVHEASLYDSNCFITLTFDDLKCSERQRTSLVKCDFQLFMKRLRKQYGSGIRFFHCGEYGSQLQRPHHHACLFNFDFPDKELFSVRYGTRLYRSPSLERLWPYGFSSIGDVTFESAAYVARYICKKKFGQLADSHYRGREPEYVTMSRRPGIAHDWFSKFKDDVYPDDFILIRDNIKCKPPRYYDKIYDNINHESMLNIKKSRLDNALKHSYDNSHERLLVREQVQLIKCDRLVRCYEKGDSDVCI